MPQAPLRPRTNYRPPPKKRGGGFGKFLLAMFVLGAAAFSYEAYRTNESPQQVWARVVNFVGGLVKPVPTPAPTPELTPTPAALPTATPIPTPQPTPVATPAPVDPLAWLHERHSRWPKEVTLSRATEFPILIGGKVVGKVKVPAGTKVALTDMGGQTIGVTYNGAPAQITVDSTDLRTIAQAEMAQPEPTSTPADLARVPVFPQPMPDSSLKPANPARQPFVHPGLLLTEADFTRMREKVNARKSPWIESWQMLEGSKQAQLNWRPRPLETVVRGGGGQNFGQLIKDIQAAYQLSLRWKISRDRRYADKALEILNGWSANLKHVVGNSDRFLAAGIYGYQFANAAEIMRTYSGWHPSDFKRFQDMMLAVFYPMNSDFLQRHNGAAITNYWANWDLCNIASMQAIGVLCDRRDIYDEAMSYFQNGKGNGAFDKMIYYVHDGNLGQWQEAGRDQGHATLGIALAGPIFETAWNQGEDWFGRDNNRFLAGAEYVAKYNLGGDVPFEFYAWGKGQKGNREEQPGVSGAARGIMRECYELVINHYTGRKGIAAPYSAQYAAKIRPEGGGGNGDQVGWGTLTFTRDPEVAQPKPSGLAVQKRGGKAVLSWWGAEGAESYNVKRASAPGGPFTTIAQGVKDILTYMDEAGENGEVFYEVTGIRDGGETQPSNVVAFTAAPELRVQLKFNETGGNAAINAVDNTSFGILQNASRGSGVEGGAVSLGEKNTSFVSLPAGVVSGLSDFTISAWVNLDSSQAWSRLFDFGDDRGQYMFLTPNRGDGMPRFEVTTVYGYNAQRIDGNTPIPTKRWVHVALTLAGHQATLYVDGVKVGENSGIDFPPFRLGATPRNWIGHSQFDADPGLAGKVDDFRIYDGALTSDEIAALAKLGARPKP